MSKAKPSKYMVPFKVTGSVLVGGSDPIAIEQDIQRRLKESIASIKGAEIVIKVKPAYVLAKDSPFHDGEEPQLVVEAKDKKPKTLVPDRKVSAEVGALDDILKKADSSVEMIKRKVDRWKDPKWTEECFKDLNYEQKWVAENIIKFERQAVIVTGPGGTGKSFLMNALKKATGARTTAMTGTAALNVGGTTIDRLFSMNRDDLSRPRSEHMLMKNIENLQWVIVDEVSMMTADMWRFIKNHVLRYNHGIKFILVGDFGQLPPVVVKRWGQNQGNGLKDSGEFLLQHPDFQHAIGMDDPQGPNIYQLTESCRQDNLDFFKQLSLLRRGIFTQEFQAMLRPCVKMYDEERAKGMTCLYATNAMADDQNARMTEDLCRVNSEAEESLRTIRSRYTADTSKKGVKYNGDIPALLKQCPLGHELQLCKHQRVLITKNDQLMAFSNGDTGIIVDIEGTGSSAEYVVLLDRTDEEVVITEMGIEVKDGSDRVCGTISGFPLRPGYAITIHKSQGQSLDKVRINMSSIGKMPRASLHGIVYVALSRARSLEGLELDCIRPEFVTLDNRVTTAGWWQ